MIAGAAIGEAEAADRAEAHPAAAAVGQVPDLPGK